MTNVKHILVFVWAFLAFSFTRSGELSAHVETTYYLKGKVGKRDIAIKMLCYDETPTRLLNYFFGDAKKDRFLIGKLKDNFWNFLPEVQQGKDDVKPEGTLAIAENKGGIWKGTFTDSAGKNWDLVLEPITGDSISSAFGDIPYVKELDPYEHYRLSSIQFTKTRTEKKTKNLFCDWYVEKESGISFFRLRPAAGSIKTDSVNAALETIHLSLVQKFFEYKPEKTGTKVESTLLYLTDELVSFKILSTITFKTIKPLQARELFTFDTRSGQQINLEDILWFDKTAVKPSPDDLYKIYKYRKNVFAQKVFGLLQELYPAKMKSDSCDIGKADSWALPVWSLTDKGIAFGFMKTGQCDVLGWAMIPYGKLEPFLESKYHLKPK